MTNEKKIIVDEIIQKFDTEENSFFKLGSVTGEVDEKGQDIIHHEVTIVIPKSKIQKFFNQFKAAVNYVEPKVDLSLENTNEKKKEKLGSPIIITHPKLR